ncbi:MAG TPA: hypothetical protein VGD74_03135, partial [Vulgatibacter sp.]
MRDRSVFDFVRRGFPLPAAFWLPILLLSAACSEDEPEVPADPAILEFAPTPEAIEAGQPVELSWKTRDAVRIQIDAGEEPIELADGTAPAAGKISVEPIEPTLYRLTATGRSGKTVEKTVEVAVTPAILSFSASAEAIRAGEAVTLSWTTLGATGVRLADEGGVDVEPAEGSTAQSGTATVELNRTTSYFLTAS